MSDFKCETISKSILGPSQRIIVDGRFTCRLQSDDKTV